MCTINRDLRIIFMCVCVFKQVCILYGRSYVSVVLLCVCVCLFMGEPVEAAEERMAYNNGWNAANGMASYTWRPCG